MAARNDKGGIDIFTAGRPGGVPTHIVNQPTTPSTTPLGQLIPGLGKLPINQVLGAPPQRTIDPIGWIGRGVKSIARRLS